MKTRFAAALWKRFYFPCLRYLLEPEFILCYVFKIVCVFFKNKAHTYMHKKVPVPIYRNASPSRSPSIFDDLSVLQVYKQ